MDQWGRMLDRHNTPKVRMHSKYLVKASVFASNLWWSLDNILRETGVIKLLVLVMVVNPEQGQQK